MKERKGGREEGREYVYYLCVCVCRMKYVWVHVRENEWDLRNKINSIRSLGRGLA